MTHTTQKRALQGQGSHSPVSPRQTRTQRTGIHDFEILKLISVGAFGCGMTRHTCRPAAISGSC